LSVLLAGVVYRKVKALAGYPAGPKRTEASSWATSYCEQSCVVQVQNCCPVLWRQLKLLWTADVTPATV